ncbi:MAG: serine/threonine-protein kinase PknH/PknJ [Mycobacterium sp.]
MVEEPTANDTAAGSRAGSRLGHYRLRRLLGRGGFGEVYEAEDTAYHRIVALKLIAAPYSQNQVFRERLFREAQHAGRLHDPHVVPIHSWGEIDEQLYIDMRLIEGTDLQSVLASDGSLGPARAVAIVRQIAAALDAAHRDQMVHRDVKPANILITRDDFACLVDFGLANAATDAKLTSSGATIGTFAYMAPERLSHAEVSHRADIYALACVLYECLTGSAPYAIGDLHALITAHLTAPIPRPSRRGRQIPVGFDDVIARGMAKNPDERYASAGELARAAHLALTTSDQDQADTILATTQAAAGDRTQAGAAEPAASSQTKARLPAKPSGSSPTTSPPSAKPAVILGRGKTIGLAVLVLIAVVLILAVITAIEDRLWQQPAPPSAPSQPAAPASPPSQPASPPSQPAAPQVYPASAIDTLLLTPAQIRTTTGGVFHGQNDVNMVVTNSSYGMSDHANQVDPPSCVGVIFGADPSVYEGTGFDAIRDQTLDVSSYATGDQVEQTAVVFPSAEKAEAVLTSQTNQWQACSNRANPYPPPTRAMQVGQRHGEGGYTWTLADVQVGDNLITLKMAGYDNEAGSDQVCQQALGVGANVVVKTRACQDISQSYKGNPVFTDTSIAGDYGETLANTMLNRVAQAMPTESPATTSSSNPAGPAVDSQGFVGHSARCDTGNSLAALIRTAQSLAVVCQTAPGNFYYHGERLSDGASIKLPNAIRSSDGFDVTNPADGTHYEVRPNRLTIISNDHVDSSEPALQYAPG